MSVFMNLVTGHRLLCKANLQNKILRPFTSTCVKYKIKDEHIEKTDINGFEESNMVEIYNGPLSSQIKAVKLFSLLTSSGGLIVQPMILQKASEHSTHIAVIVGVGTFIGFFTFVTPLLLHLITKKYVRTIHYDQQTDSYIAKTYSLFLRDKVVIFKAEDVVVPDVPGMFTSFRAKGEPLFVEVRKFNDMGHYKKIMGYDKPLDFKLDDNNNKKSN